MLLEHGKKHLEIKIFMEIYHILFWLYQSVILEKSLNSSVPQFPHVK